MSRMQKKKQDSLRRFFLCRESFVLGCSVMRNEADSPFRPDFFGLKGKDGYALWRRFPL